MFPLQSACRSVYTGNHPAKYNSVDYKAGYSNSIGDSTLFSAHPMKFISADSQDKKMKHLRLSNTCSDMYTSYKKPTIQGKACKKVTCPPQITFPYPNPYDRKLLTCWKC